MHGFARAGGGRYTNSSGVGSNNILVVGPFLKDAFSDATFYARLYVQSTFTVPTFGATGGKCLAEFQV